MNKLSVTQAITLASNGGLTEFAPKIPAQSYEKVLGPLKDTVEVPKILRVIGYFGPIQPHSKEELNGTGAAVDRLHRTMEAVLLKEYGQLLPKNYTITVRWKDEQWVVVGVPNELVRLVTYNQAAN